MERNISVTFACYNQSAYTKACLDSMLTAGDDLSRVVVVDNASSDNTLALLSEYPLRRIISNKTNLGCGVAWNQGVLELQSEWSVIMNNDVLVSPGWLSGLVLGAEQSGLAIASPAMIEGPNDYEFEQAVSSLQAKTNQFVRRDLKHAVCLAVHRSVFEKIGYFQPIPSLLGFEDTIFFAAADRAGIKSGIVGSSWIHHFGSITQKAMKEERGLSQSEGLGSSSNKRLLGRTWLERKAQKFIKKKREQSYRDQEVRSCGVSLHGLRIDGQFQWI